MITTVFRSIPEFLVVAGALGLSQLVYSLVGFGSGLIAVGILAMVMPEIVDVIVVLMLVCLPVEITLIWRSWKALDRKNVALVCAGILIGVPLGTELLTTENPMGLLMLLGIFLVVVGIAFLLLPQRGRVDWPVWAAPPIGRGSGVLSGMFGTGAPPLIIYYQLGRVDKLVFRSNLLAIFLCMALVRLISYSATGLITPARVWSALAVSPAILLGAWLGNRIHLQMSEARFRVVVSCLLVALGLLQLV